jgi:uncharacterized protein YndB with AHSA1/START domain
MSNRNELRIEAERLIDAPAATVYRCLADYREHHPRILPPAFSNLTVERGGVGDGTIVSFDLRLGGRSRHYRAQISEPEPGRTLAETDLNSGAVTTFTVTPEGQASRVRIGTVYQPAGGLQGWIERKLAPRMLAKLYDEELANLERHARAQAQAV